MSQIHKLINCDLIIQLRQLNQLMNFFIIIFTISLQMNIQKILRKMPPANSEQYKHKNDSTINIIQNPNQTNKNNNNNIDLKISRIHQQQSINISNVPHITTQSQYQSSRLKQTPTQNENAVAKKSLLDNQLNQIQKLKQKYESKVSERRSILRGSQVNSCRSQSKQKHLLKPSNNPVIMNQKDQETEEVVNRYQVLRCQKNKSQEKIAHVNYQQMLKRLRELQLVNGQQHRLRLIAQQELIQTKKLLEQKCRRISEMEYQIHQNKQKLKETMLENLKLKEDNEKAIEDKSNSQNMVKQLLQQKSKQLSKQKEKNNIDNAYNDKKIIKKDPTIISVPPGQEKLDNMSQQIKRSRVTEKQNHNIMNLSKQNSKGKMLSSVAVNEHQKNLRLRKMQQQEKKIKVQTILNKLKIKVSR